MKNIDNIKKIFADAIEKKYALCAFNFTNLEQLKAIIAVCTEENVPVILQASQSAIDYIGADYLRAIILCAKNSSKTPVIFHYDHGKTLDACKDAIDIGFDSVMIDGSTLSFEDNVNLTTSVVSYAHSKDVFVEAEIGALAGVEDEVNVCNDDSKFTSPNEAKTFVAKTGVDSLAVAIGTSHGAYKFIGDAKLRFDILSKIEQLLPKTPLVLHGASGVSENLVKIATMYGAKLGSAKGVSNELLSHAVHEHNICKVNMDTDLRIAYTTGIRKVLTENPENIDIRKYSKIGSEFVRAVVKEKINLLSK